MRFDLHVHTYYSRDSLMTPEAIVRAAQRHGLDGLAITDHNSIAGALEVRAAAPFPVIIGEEIATTQGEIIGLFLREPIPRRLSPEETIAAIRAQGGIVYVPHPLDRTRHSAMRLRNLLQLIDRVDALEVFNARNLIPQDNIEARKLAQEHGLAMGAGSDAHTPYEIGRAWVEIDGFTDAASFFAALQRGEATGKLTTPLIHGLTTLTKVWRRVGGKPRKAGVSR